MNSNDTASTYAPQQGPMEFDVLRRYLARAHNNSQDRASRWGHRPTSAYLEAWNWCNDIEAGATTARHSWLAQRAISAVTEVCPLNFA